MYLDKEKIRIKTLTMKKDTIRLTQLVMVYYKKQQVLH